MVTIIEPKFYSWQNKLFLPGFVISPCLRSTHDLTPLLLPDIQFYDPLPSTNKSALFLPPQLSYILSVQVLTFLISILRHLFLINRLIIHGWLFLLLNRIPLNWLLYQWLVALLKRWEQGHQTSLGYPSTYRVPQLISVKLPRYRSSNVPLEIFSWRTWMNLHWNW